MNNKKISPRFISFRPGSIIYLAVLILSLIFTQALRSPASTILFIFLLLLPIISFIYLIVARAGIKVYTECDTTRAEKGEPVGYEIKIINETPVPFPFVETVVSLPSENAVICEDEFMRITLLPMGAHIIKSIVHFPLRGSYDIGVKYLYIGDLFGMFRTEVKLELHRTVIVYPRNIAMSRDSNRNDTDLPTPTMNILRSNEKAELSDIRSYIPGDSMKNIHWKLSSKSDDLQVKSYSSNTDRHTYILCDLSFSDPARYTLPDPPKKEAEFSKKGRRFLRRGRGRKSAAVSAAISAGDVNEPLIESTAQRSSKERLQALGVTDEHIAKVENLDVMNEMTVEDSATGRGAKNAQRLAAERMAKLAMVITDSEIIETQKNSRSRFNPENLPYAGELAADSVIELALSAMRHEVGRGAECTVLYPDSRSDNGFGILSSANDIEGDLSLLKFFTAPVCFDSDAFASLAMMIEGSAGLTIRMVTANTDIYSAAIFAALPAAFGGAGTGCTAEVMLASPEGIWASDSERGVAAEAMRSELSRSSVGMRQFICENGGDGSIRFTADN